MGEPSTEITEGTKDFDHVHAIEGNVGVAGAMGIGVTAKHSMHHLKNIGVGIGPQVACGVLAKGLLPARRNSASLGPPIREVMSKRREALSLPLRGC